MARREFRPLNTISEFQRLRKLYIANDIWEPVWRIRKLQWKAEKYKRDCNQESRSEQDAMGGSSGPKLSGMQKQVLGLYRGFLRAAHAKSPEDRSRIESIVSAEFRRNSKIVDRKNFTYIEYLLRRGKKQLEQLKSPDTIGLSHLNVEHSHTKKS